MPQKSAVAKQTWFLNPWFDLLLLSGVPFILLLPLLFHLSSEHQQFLYLAFNLPHVVSGLGIAALFSKETRASVLTYLGIPVALIAGSAIMLQLQLLFLMQVTRTYWGIHHDLLQHHTILARGKEMNSDTRTLDRRIDLWTLIAAILYVPAHLLYHDLQKIPAIPPGCLHVFERALRVLPFVLGIFFAAVAIRQLYRWIAHREVYVFKMALFFKIVTIYFILPLVIGDMRKALILGIILHCQQYLCWTWLFLQKEGQRTTTAIGTFLGKLAQPRMLPRYLLLIALVSGSFFFVMGRLWPMNIYSPVLAYMHFFFDGLLWKIY